MQNQEQFEEPQETNRYAPQALAAQTEASRALAAQGLKQIEAAHFENVLAAARTEAHAYRKRRQMNTTAGWLFGSVFGLMAIYWIYGLATGKDTEGWSNFYIYGGLFSSFGVAMSQNHKEAAVKLAQFDDVRAVGLLTETLDSSDKDLMGVSRDALTRLLPRLQFSDAALLSAEQRDILNRALPKAATKKDRALSLAILQAYQQVGSEKEAAVVERLATSPVAAYDSELRQAALDCLPFLRDSIARRNESHVLLRASQADSNRPETLLRPAAYAGNQTDAQELLRSSQTES